jgi:hypothetical protein
MQRDFVEHKMKTVIRIIPKTLDIIAIILFGMSLFLLSPLGKPLITEQLVETEYQPIPTQKPQMPPDSNKVTYFPDGHKSVEVTLKLDISVSLSLSGEATYYSIVYRIIDVYRLIDQIQSILFLAGIYLYIRTLWIVAQRLTHQSTLLTMTYEQ